MIRDVDLLSYYPKFLQLYREFYEISNAENKELQHLFDATEKIKNNQFITSSDIDGIKKFESLLKIYPSSDDTLKSRISRVMARWNDIVPYTYKALAKKLFALSDSDDFELHPDFNNYALEIITRLDLPGQVDELQNLISYIMPANLVVTSSNEIHCEADATFKMSSWIASSVDVNITDNFDEDYQIDGDNNMSVGVVFTEINGIA
jgi:hypothetical protein